MRQSPRQSSEMIGTKSDSLGSAERNLFSPSRLLISPITFDFDRHAGAYAVF